MSKMWVSYRQMTVTVIWSIFCIVSALNAGSFEIEDLMDMMRKNINNVVSWTWYAMMAASCCIACILTRTLLMVIQGVEVGSFFTSMLFNAGLAVAASLYLESISAIDLGTPNNAVEEVILSITAGHYFYEMFYLRTKNSLGDSLKVLSTVSATSFIMASLGNGTGARVILTFLFLFSSSVPILKLTFFGSSKFANTTAYKVSIRTALAFAAYQRIVQAPVLFLKFWNSPSFHFEQFECAYYISVYSLAIGICFGLVDVIHMREHKEKEVAKLKNEPINKELISHKRNKRACAYE